MLPLPSLECEGNVSVLPSPGRICKTCKLECWREDDRKEIVITFIHAGGHCCSKIDKTNLPKNMNSNETKPNFHRKQEPAFHKRTSSVFGIIQAAARTTTTGN